MRTKFEMIKATLLKEISYDCNNTLEEMHSELCFPESSKEDTTLIAQALNELIDEGKVLRLLPEVYEVEGKLVDQAYYEVPGFEQNQGE